MNILKKAVRNRRFFALILTVAMALSLAACGKSSGGGAPVKEYLWVPEFITIDDENVSYYDMQIVGNDLYYESNEWDEATQTSSQSICKYSLEDGSITRTPLTWTTEGDNNYLNRSVFAQDGSVYGVTTVWSEDGSSNQSYLIKFGSDGKQVLSQDLSDLVGDSYVDSLAVDGEGRVYISGDGKIWLFDGEGNRKGEVSLSSNGWIRSMGCGKDGKMYACYYDNDGYVLSEIDFDGKTTGATYENFPSGNSERLVPGIEKDFLVQDGQFVYEYDMKSQSVEELFSWLDSDINGNYVQGYGAMEDGRLLAIIQDWESEDNGIALLTKTKASEVPQKETIVIGCLYGAYDLQSMAVKFNKTNEKYRVSIRTYVDNNWGGGSNEDYQNMMNDAMNRMNNDITSSNNCPDILDLSGLNMKQLAAKGVFEDLVPYLDKSSKLNREDFLENIIESYTIDGTLVSIPYSFQMMTVAGKASEVGKEMGWTVDDMIAYADAHPDAQLFDNTTKQAIMMYLMVYNADYFIDWNTGECKFDSDEFKSLLNFVNRFPDDYDNNGDETSTPNKIQQGDVLLYEMNIYDFNEVQLCEEIFQGDASYIGYPTMDGSQGCMMAASQAYAMTSKSGHKDGAWEFLESFLTQEDSDDRGFRGWGFPTQKSKLEKQAKEASEVKYWTDENGELVLDENGDPIPEGGGSSFSYQDGWSYEYRTPTQEEVDTIMSLIKIAKPVAYSQGDEVMTIINEEAEPFYKGQKSVDEVASVIQSRVKIYVGENK